MKKSVITKNDKISWWNGTFFCEDIIDLAISLAYKDMMRTIMFFSSNPKHDEIKKKATFCLKQIINEFFDKEISDQDVFDKLHKEACYKLITAFDGQYFTIGQSQKWLNMTFKYLNLLEYNMIDKVYEYCHVPIDRYILSITNYEISKPWSKLNDYEEYFEYQKWFRNEFKDDIPLDKEFYLWLEELKNQKN